MHFGRFHRILLLGLFGFGPAFADPASKTLPQKSTKVAQATPTGGSAKPPADAGGTSTALDKAFSSIAAEKAGALTAPQKADFLQGIALLKPLAHAIDSSMIGPKADSILLNLQIDPRAIITHGEQLVQIGAFASAQYALVGLARVCAECHATTVTKPAWKQLMPSPQLSEFERGQFYKIVGKDAESLLSYERVITNKGLAASRRDIWERAATSLVGLAIRREDSPFTYVDILSNALGTAGLPPAEKDLVTRWRAAGKTWEKEAPLGKSPTEAMQKAQSLMNAPRKDPLATFVESARAMNLLRAAQAGAAKAQAFRMAGELRERLGPDGIWFNAEDYYHACIRSAPKSAESGQCWDLLRSLPQRNKNFVLMDDVARQLQALAR